MATINERVRRGAALLDERTPGWMERINLDRLDIGSLADCPLGQVFGGFWAGHQHLWGTLWMSGEARQHGFADLPKNFTALTETWRALISERRASDAH
jgi:hypothetical protein